MTIDCPCCNRFTEINLYEDGEVRQSEHDVTVYHVRCSHCSKKFRLVERTKLVYAAETIE